MNTPEAKINWAARTLQNMLECNIRPLPTDTEHRFREMLATLRAAGSAVADLRADRPRRAWQGFSDRRRPGITGRMQEVR